MTLDEARQLVGRTWERGKARLTIEGADIEPPNGDVYFATDSLGLVWYWEIAGFLSRATEVTP